MFIVENRAFISNMADEVSPEDVKMINHIVDKLKREGLFDQFRKECLADVDTKVSTQTKYWFILLAFWF